MPLLLRRLAAVVPASLRRSLCTAASPSPSHPPWTMLYNRPALNESGAPPPPPGARASLDHFKASLVTQLSVPAHLIDPDGDATGFLGGTVRAASSDGLLLLDFDDARQFRHSWLHEFYAAGGPVEPDASRFVCNPLSGQLFRLPAPGMAVAKMGTPFGLLTDSSDGSHGPPDRYVVAQLCRGGCGELGSRRVVRRFLSETGAWDEQELVGPSTVPAGRKMCIDLKHEVVAFGGRLWWADVRWGVCSVDPFSDQPEHRFVELPHDSVLPDLAGMVGTSTLGRYRRVGVSEGKLRYVEVSNTRNPFVVSSFSLDEEGRCWTLDYKIKATSILPQGFEGLEHNIPCTAAIDPFNANFVYLNYGPRIVLVLDMAKGKNLGGFFLPERIGCQTLCPSGFLVPCMLPTWLESSHIPCAGSLSSKKTSCKRNTLAGMLVRADRDQKK
ncbi:uncharacterized protein [Lolium perenne]|uniref:uncharacterized protein n=1 Tax=Lolium perenne TaxID=4522 RepID=UPI0021F5FAC7|nr:uncharacterized protein LOC127320383 [Lolium perenne]